MATIMVGDDFSVDFNFTLLGTSTLADPALVQVLQRKPDLSEVVYVYPDDEQITRRGEGQYTFTQRVVNEPRRHIIRPIGTDEVNKSQEVFVDVTESYFLDPLP